MADYRVDGYCILNADGEVWSPMWFATHFEAERYLESKRAQHPDWGLSKHRVVAAGFTISPKNTAERR